jgi:hypothetical protein
MTPIIIPAIDKNINVLQKLDVDHIESHIESDRSIRLPSPNLPPHVEKQYKNSRATATP